MFGIKIISKKKYDEMNELVERHTASHKATEEVIKKLKRDCESLRQQNSELRQFKRDVMDALGSIDLAGFQVSICNTKCNKCKNEQPDCRRYTFGVHDFCVTKK